MKTKRGIVDLIAVSLLTAGLSCAYTVHLDKPLVGYESENYKLDWIHVDKNEYTYCFNKKIRTGVETKVSSNNK